MDSKTQQVSIRYRDDKVILDLYGEINAFADQALSAAYSEAEAHGSETIVLNFENVEYINSTGIALIVEMLAQARKNKKNLVVFGLSDHYKEVFELTRLADFMTIYESEDLKTMPFPGEIVHPKEV